MPDDSSLRVGEEEVGKVVQDWVGEDGIVSIECANNGDGTWTVTPKFQ